MPNIIYTTDGGINWQGDDFPYLTTVPYLFDVTCPSSEVCYAGGSYGTVLKKTNADFVTNVYENIACSVGTLNVSPNPTLGYCNVVVPEYMETTYVLLYNCLGKEMLRVAPIKGISTLDLTSLPSGIYLVKAGSATRRIIKL